jgi:hypothetical protein
MLIQTRTKTTIRKKKRTRGGINDIGKIWRRLVDDCLTIPDHLNRHFTRSKGNFELVNTWGYRKCGR